MPEIEDATRRRWSGYVCPDCRFVFRIARDHAGQGALCPNCRRVLRIPKPGDSPAPLVVPLPEPAPDAAGSKGVKRRRRRKSRSAADPGWEQSADHVQKSASSGTQHMRGMLVFGGLLLAIVIGGVMLAMLRSKPPANATPADALALASPPQLEESTAAQAEMSDGEFLTAAEPLARSFLSAKRIEDLLAVVREPQRAESRMRAMYPDGRIEPPGLDAFNTNADIGRNGAILSVQVRTREFEEKAMSFAVTPDGLKIDWEAWVAWSEMPWSEFLAKKPVTPVLFRVLLSPIDYYNFAFTDDDKWRSYRLSSPDGEHALYGYVERGSLMDSRIRLSPDVKRSPMILRLAFPAGGDSRNQVLVRELLAEGWVLENEESP